MNSLSFETLLAVLEEIFGRTLFWSLVVISVLITLSFIYVLWRDRRIVPRRLLWAEIAAPIGAIAAIAIVLLATRSSLGDIGGATDVILMFAIGLAGAIGFAFLTYTFLSYIHVSKTKK